jgi:hypothetical protein
MKVARLSAIHTGHLYPQEIFLVLISVRDRVDPRAIVQLEGLCQSKTPVIPPGIDPATFRFVVQCLNHCATACHIYWQDQHERSIPALLNFKVLHMSQTLVVVQSCHCKKCLGWRGEFQLIRHYVQLAPLWLSAIYADQNKPAISISVRDQPHLYNRSYISCLLIWSWCTSCQWTESTSD